MSKVLRIERASPPAGPPELPFRTPQGFKLANPAGGKERHHAEWAVYAVTLEEVADLLAKGFPLWMKQAGKRETLISPSSLRVILA